MSKYIILNNLGGGVHRKSSIYADAIRNLEPFQNAVRIICEDRVGADIFIETPSTKEIFFIETETSWHPDVHVEYGLDATAAAYIDRYKRHDIEIDKVWFLFCDMRLDEKECAMFEYCVESKS